MGEPSFEIRKRVQVARDRQHIRFMETDIICNSDMRVAEVRKFCKLDEAGDSLVRQAMKVRQRENNVFEFSYQNCIFICKKILCAGTRWNHHLWQEMVFNRIFTFFIRFGVKFHHGNGSPGVCTTIQPL